MENSVSADHLGLNDNINNNTAPTNKLPKHIQAEFDMIEEKICQSQLYAYDTIGIHSAIYSTIIREIYIL